jgi:uncharacterized membrane protein YkvA (DUF1232 family)
MDSSQDVQTQALSRALPPMREDLQRLILPILKRAPGYLRLGLALLRDPALPARYKLPIYGCLVYSASPLRLAANLIPIVGQIDNTLLFLVGLRLALSHCPPEVAERHLARVHFTQNQVDEDLRAVLSVAGRAVRHTGRAVRHTGRGLRFVGRVAAGFTRRQALRVLADGERSASDPRS